MLNGAELAHCGAIPLHDGSLIKAGARTYLHHGGHGIPAGT